MIFAVSFADSSSSITLLTVVFYIRLYYIWPANSEASAVSEYKINKCFHVDSLCR